MNRYLRINFRDDEDEAITHRLLPHHNNDTHEGWHLSPLHRRRTPCRHWMPLVGALTLLGICSGVVYLPPARTSTSGSSGVSSTALIWSPFAAVSDVPSADQDIIDLYARQSKTLEEATARYTLKTGRQPPPNFDKWFQFAQEGHCLIDDYDRIDQDFAPFYQLANQNPRHFRNMVEMGHEFMRDDARGLSVISVRQGKVELPDDIWGTPWDIDLEEFINEFGYFIPDMDLLLNGNDEPRVAFNARRPNALKNAMQLKEADPFRVEPVPTADFFRGRDGCDMAQTSSGFVKDPVNSIAFFASTSTSGFSTDLWPMLSMAKISPCFSDIVYPNAYFYDKSGWSGQFSYPDDLDWRDKQPIVYWRGVSNGGHIYGDNYRNFPRFRLMDIARDHPELFDVRISSFADNHCTEDCDADRIIEEYNITGEGSAREDLYGSKYALDVDGNSFSGRFLGLLRSGSLVFKATVFTEYFSEWLLPYEHFIPVNPDLSDLVEKIQWARDNDEEARKIQQRGLRFATKVVTDKQNDCYLSRLLLEWSRLQNDPAAASTSEETEEVEYLANEQTEGPEYLGNEETEEPEYLANEETEEPANNE
ncbi:CAP10 domain-containing protein [Mycena indigotica]|uniref:CAP10 domain-containing protein n=1 Tax=Mycena indigotica TaxID=2126181 RepID=A0A8H6SET4_9AGAR|nr:CAP10 domain-containing protein [Mycena indigotica]KAF7297401.1 CAP10 domain-containing protein [Mycena indigotica]